MSTAAEDPHAQADRERAYIEDRAFIVGLGAGLKLAAAMPTAAAYERYIEAYGDVQVSPRMRDRAHDPLGIVLEAP
jgi:hypothetical protein